MTPEHRHYLSPLFEPSSILAIVDGEPPLPWIAHLLGRLAGSGVRHTLLDAHADLPLFRYFIDGRPAREVWRFSAIRRLGTKVSVWATSKMLGKDPDLQITSFRLIRRFLVEAMLQTNTYLPQIGNLLVLSSNRIINVPVHHDARAYGKSGYSFRRLVKDLLYDITSHSAFPLLLVRDFGICSFLVSVGLGIFFLIRYFLYGISVEGWTSLMLVLLAFFGITLLSIGIMGIYLMNILNESKKMPHYVIRRKDV